MSNLRRLRSGRLRWGENGRGDRPPEIDELKAGSNEAWAYAVATLGPHLRSYVSLRGSDDPDGTLGDVFLELSRNIDRFDGDWDSFRTLAFVVARRRAVDSIRYRTRRPSTSVDMHSVENATAGGDVEQEAMDELGREWALELLDVLTPIQRDVLTMRLVVGLSIREVADITGATETGVKANQRRALAALRRHLSGEREIDGHASLDRAALALGYKP